MDECRAALDEGSRAGEFIAQVRRTWLDTLETHLREGGVTVAVINTDLLWEKGGLLDELRADGYDIDAP